MDNIITVYHGTTTENAKKISSCKELRIDAPGLFDTSSDEKTRTNKKFIYFGDLNIAAGYIVNRERVEPSKDGYGVIFKLHIPISNLENDVSDLTRYCGFSTEQAKLLSIDDNVDQYHRYCVRGNVNIDLYQYSQIRIPTRPDNNQLIPLINSQLKLFEWETLPLK